MFLLFSLPSLICECVTVHYTQYGPVQFLSPYVSLLQANGIIKKLQGEVRGLVGKIKVKNTVMVSQEKILQDTSEKLQNVEKNLQSTQQQLVTNDEKVWNVQEHCMYSPTL